MDRRAFLRSTGLVGGGAALGGAAAAASAERHDLVTVSRSGHAVGPLRPFGLTSTTLTYRVPTREPVVALTFDDGPSREYTAAVLDILRAKGVPATFNLIGRHVTQLPDLARRVAAAHEVGNHTWSHPNLSLAGAQEAQRQLERGAGAIESVTGTRPATFRPPFGYFSGATMMAAAGLHLPVVLWDQAFDRHGESPAANVDRLAAAVQPGSIVLGHDGGSLPCDVVVAALPSLIDRLRARGLSFVTTSALLALERPDPANA